MVRYGGTGLAHRQEVAEGVVVLQLQGADANALALLLLLMAEPGVLIVQLVAQPIQQRVDAVMDQIALGEGERGASTSLWRIVRASPPGLDRGRAATYHPSRADRRVQPGGELGQLFQAIGDGH